MKRRYAALRAFSSPLAGEVEKGQELSLPPETGAAWAKAGLVRELKETKNDPVHRAGREVSSDGK